MFLCPLIFADPVPFPDELSCYGLTIELLEDAFGCGADFQWSVRGVPNVEFYRKLHSFLRRWDTTRSATKTSIGKFYLTIDKQLQERGSTPYNTYRFIERLASSDVPDACLMSYGSDKNLHAEMRGRFQVLDDKIKEQQAEINKLRTEFERTKGDLLLTKGNLQELASEVRSRRIFCKETL